MLAKDPQKITVGDVIKAMREPTDPVFCVDSVKLSTKSCKRADECVTRLVWKEAGDKINTFFNSITISDLCERASNMGVKKDMKHPFDYNI